MPDFKSAKRNREYSKLKGKFKREDRYPGREEEVAARIVNKHRAEKGAVPRGKSASKTKAGRKAKRSTGRRTAKA